MAYVLLHRNVDRITKQKSINGQLSLGVVDEQTPSLLSGTGVSRFTLYCKVQEFHSKFHFKRMIDDSF